MRNAIRRQTARKEKFAESYESIIIMVQLWTRQDTVYIMYLPSH